MKIAFVIGRMVFGGFFLYNGLNHFKQRQALSQYAGAKGMPMAEVAVPLSGAVLIAGGMSMLFGIKPKLGAAAIIAFLATASPMMHDFWTAEEPNQRMNDFVHFSKNMALLGSALALMGMREPWPVSIPWGHPSRLERIRKAVLDAIAV